jgi:hypothetical protein
LQAAMRCRLIRKRRRLRPAERLSRPTTLTN